MPAPARIHSFVIRLWLEEEDGPEGEPLWRGHITHVHTQTTRYVEALNELTAFIQTHLTTDGDA